MSTAVYSVIPRAAGRIQETLGLLKVRPSERHYTPAVAAAKRARFYMTPVDNSRGQRAWFKASLQDAPWLRRGLRDEISIHQAFEAYERRSRPAFDTPSFIAAGNLHSSWTWLLRKYWAGTFAGDMDDRFGLSASFLRQVSPLYLAKALADVRRLGPFLRRRHLKFETHGLGWYLLDFHYYRRHFFSPLLGHRLNPGWTRDDNDKMEGLFLHHRSFLRQHATVLAHGDLYPNNILVRPNGGVVLFDWELAHWNLPTFDVALIYLLAWRHPAWQEQFLNRSLRLIGQPRLTPIAWRLSLLSLATRLTAFCFIRLTNGQPERYPRLTAAQRRCLWPLYKIWLRHLTTAYQALP